MRTKVASPAAAGELWEHSPLPCFVLDRRGRIVSSNQAAAAFLGRPPAELPGLDLLELFTPAPLLAAILRSRKVPAAGDWLTTGMAG